MSYEIQSVPESPVVEEVKYSPVDTQKLNERLTNLEENSGSTGSSSSLVKSFVVSLEDEYGQNNMVCPAYEEEVNGMPTPINITLAEFYGEEGRANFYSAVNIKPFYDEETGDLLGMYFTVYMGENGDAWYNVFQLDYDGTLEQIEQYYLVIDQDEEPSEYQTYCENNLEGTWDASAQTCTFNWYDPNIGENVEKIYGTETIDGMIDCSEAENGSYWDFENDMCCDPECDCLKSGGIYSQETGECTLLEPVDPCENALNPDECLCTQMGGVWIEDPENPGTYICDYPEPPVE